MKKKKGKIRKIFGTISDTVMTLILIGLTTASICGVAFAMYINQVVAPQADIDIAGLTLNLTSKVYYTDENGIVQELESLHGEQNRIWAEFEDIPNYLSEAFVSIEDERFYTHDGVDWIRTVGAAVNWIVPIRDGSFGGSTITQQLIKNTTGDNDFTVTRKITEILRALSLDKKMEKDDILELYLNTIYLGRNAYGVFTAAETYFGKDLSELNLAECAVIAGITNNPSYYDPFRYPDNIKKRQETILYAMYEQGKITEEQKDEAIAYELDYKTAENESETSSTQSYFVDAVIEDVLADLMEQKGYTSQVASQLLYSGGLSIYSTVDMFVQETMESVYENDENFPDISGKDGALPQSSMVVIDPSNGQVKGIIGGRGEKTAARVLNRATQTTRSPGSAIKPVSVFAPAIDAGIITPISVYGDTPYDFETSAAGWPKNYYTGYKGQLTIFQSVANSVNTVAVKVLADLGTRASFNFATTKMGLDLVESRTTSSGQVVTDIALSPLALGGLTDGISTLELTAAYVPFANEGVYYEPITYTKVLDSEGNVILENNVEGIQAFEDPDTVYYMRQLLEGVVTSGTGTAAKILGIDTLGKTGTTNSDYDRWFVGATPYYVAATWFGYDTQQTVSGVSTNPALALWEDVMDVIHADLPNATFEDPTNFVSTSYCLDSGLLPTEYCTMDVRGSRVAYASVASGDQPTEYCNIHQPVDIDILNGNVATEYCPVEKVETRVLLDLTRMFPIELYVTDEQYTFEGANPAIGEGEYRAMRTSSSITATTYSGIACTVHTAENSNQYFGYEYDFVTGQWINVETGEIYVPETDTTVPSDPLEDTELDTNVDSDIILPDTTDDVIIPQIPDVDDTAVDEEDDDNESEDESVDDSASNGSNSGFFDPEA
ncbi:MAG: PBP1A family penicillin-binding protein [Clostridia bacterium]